MRDRGKILLGIAIFLVVVLFPIWFTAAFGKPGAVPTPKAKEGAGECIFPADYMRVHHMEILDDWRDLVVRQEQREWTGPDGRTHEMSLTRTCMDCHIKADSCDVCHTYADVKPYCWDCHLERN